MAKDKPLEEFMQFNDGSGKALNCQENCLYGSGKAFLNFNDGSGKALKCRKKLSIWLRKSLMAVPQMDQYKIFEVISKKNEKCLKKGLTAKK